MFGVDHYGGQHMHSMPSFCVGVEATTLADVGGTPGPLTVPRDVAVEQAVNHARTAGVDVAVSYAMEVDHGFTQALMRLCGGLDKYPVLPIFVSCIQPPFVPFAHARALGDTIGRYLATVDARRVLLVGTGGLGHDPRILSHRSMRWAPSGGRTTCSARRRARCRSSRGSTTRSRPTRWPPRSSADPNIPDEAFGLHEDWDKAFLAQYCSGDLTAFDTWQPEQVVADGGIGAMEVLSWVAAGQAMATLTGAVPQQRLQQICRVIGVGFGIVSAGPVPISRLSAGRRHGWCSRQ